MTDKVRVLIVGINGYGDVYMNALLKRPDANIVGVVEIAPDRSRYYDALQSNHIPIYSTLRRFYEKHQADLAIISTPIQLHTEHVVEALKNGSYVLCEKPLTAESEDFAILDEAVKQSGKWAAIGFNWSFSKTIQAVKRDRIRGMFGRPKTLRTLVLWPRSTTYFNRSNWAGKRYALEGKAVFDSIANNAAAHFLHNMLYVLGDEIDSCVQVMKVEADLYKANAIETFDTCAIRTKTADGADLLFYASHSTREEIGPMFEYEFEHATVKYECDDDTGKVIAYFHDGSIKEYGNLDVNHKEALTKLDTCIEAVQKNSTVVPCTHETAKTHVQVIESLRELPVKQFEEERIERIEGQYTVKGLLEITLDCYQMPTLSGMAFAPFTERLDMQSKDS
ncbi:Gfo/Idh/MocA family oxidoreductase [Bacillus sp. JCM 19041]|uniref:Gfo/Idh/MocA family protein n=1 Tax=Bacillus sp. JCM 19041 TaxID=1460637 RepID=UPI0006D26D02